MELLNQPISKFNFEDIVAFCEQKHREGIQLEYKLEIPKSGLSKQIASFSNSRGGVIIVGVEEDKKTGQPIKWEGLDNSFKEDLIHQFASNIDPLPNYDVHITNEKEGRFFVLIRVFEGDRTPYYIQNDSHLWVRTGSISNPIDIASPQETRYLYEKLETASLARQNNTSQTLGVYYAGLRNAEKERLRLIAEEKEKNLKNGVKDYKSTYYQHKIGDEHSGMCSILIQPFYPLRPLIKPNSILDNLGNLVVRSYGNEFPKITHNFQSIPNGIMSFDWSDSSGDIECQQIYSNGLVYDIEDVVKVDENKFRITYLSWITSKLFLLLQSSLKYYDLVNYQGSLNGYLKLENFEDVHIMRIIPTGYSSNPFNESKKCLLPEYKWEIDIDTSLLRNREEFQNFYVEKIREIYWSLGFENVSDDIVNAYLKDIGWLKE